MVDQAANTIVGRVLREVREDGGMSRGDVEARSHGRISVAALGSWERGERALSLPSLVCFAETCRVDARHLLALIDSRMKTAA